ncbi:response regulator transcription factor [Frankia sp. CcWB3]
MTIGAAPPPPVRAEVSGYSGYSGGPPRVRVPACPGVPVRAEASAQPECPAYAKDLTPTEIDGGVSVFLLHAHPVTGVGLHLLLSTICRLDVVGRSHRLDAALPQIRRSRPRVLLLGLAGDLATDLAAVRRLRAEADRIPITRVLLLRPLATCAELTQILTTGASGAVLPDTPPADLAHAVTIAALGGVVFLPAPPPTGVPGPPVQAELPPQVLGLTSRERAVLGQLARGLSNAEIACELALAEATVKRYLTGAMRKIGQPDRLRAGLYAYRHGLLDGPHAGWTGRGRGSGRGSALDRAPDRVIE